MNYATYVQEQVSKEDFEKLQQLGVNLDTGVLARLWPDFVNFLKREESEVPFLRDQLTPYTKPKVFNACLGSGATTFGLKRAGFDDIVSNEIDKNLIFVARQEANKLDLSLDVASYDWRDLKDRYREDFDVVLCLGNSLTYLFKKDDQIKSLGNFRDMLKPKGKLIIDERNYPHHFSGKGYKFSGSIVYCGKGRVIARPIYISESMVVMEYQHRKTMEKAHLVLYPFKENEILDLLKNVGFLNIRTFGDYRKKFKPERPEFITYVAEK